MKPALAQKSLRGGRPRSIEPNNTVCSWVPARVHDRLIQVANQREMSVSEYVRRVLIFAIKDDSSGPFSY